MKTLETMPDMLSIEMQSIARAFTQSKPKPKIFELVQDAQGAIERAKTLIIEHSNDPNATMLELNEAYGLLETLYSNASMEILESEIL